MFTATQIADWIVRFRSEAGAPVDPMSLQKLLYYVQAFHLARHGEPLFANGFEAWKYGPVLPRIWHKYRENSAPLPLEEPTLSPEDEMTAQISPEIEDELRDTVGFFSRMTPFGLSDATHKEDPWLNARRGLDPHEKSESPISQDEIRIYYAGLLWDGEDALSRQELLDEVQEPQVGSFYQAGICIRGMKNHPFYDTALAKILLRSVSESEEPELPDDLYAPIKRRDFVRARDL